MKDNYTVGSNGKDYNFSIDTPIETAISIVNNIGKMNEKYEQRQEIRRVLKEEHYGHTYDPHSRRCWTCGAYERDWRDRPQLCAVTNKYNREFLIDLAIIDYDGYIRK